MSYYSILDVLLVVIRQVGTKLQKHYCTEGHSLIERSGTSVWTKIPKRAWFSSIERAQVTPAVWHDASSQDQPSKFPNPSKMISHYDSMLIMKFRGSMHATAAVTKLRECASASA
jgi:hypothetical protein